MTRHPSSLGPGEGRATDSDEFCVTQHPPVFARGEESRAMEGHNFLVIRHFSRPHKAARAQDLIDRSLVSEPRQIFRSCLHTCLVPDTTGHVCRNVSTVSRPVPTSVPFIWSSSAASILALFLNAQSSRAGPRLQECPTLRRPLCTSILRTVCC